MARLPRTLGEIGTGLTWRKARLRFACRQLAIRYWWARRGILPVSGVRIRTGPHLSPVILDSIEREMYERPELEIARVKLQRDDVVLELGSGIGFITTYCAKRIGSDRVFTYEANPALESHIR